MKIVADESVDFRIVTSLREKGHQVYAIVEKHPSIQDPEVLEIACDREALLITEDKDFGELTFRLKKRHFGILLLKLSGLPIEEKNRIVHAVLENSSLPLSKNFAVVDKIKVRIKETK